MIFESLKKYRFSMVLDHTFAPFLSILQLKVRFFIAKLSLFRKFNLLKKLCFFVETKV